MRRRVKSTDRAGSVLLFVLALALDYSAPPIHAAEPATAPALAKIAGPGNCAECHRPMHDTWRHTMHYKSFQDMHRMRSARRIADNLGIDRIKQDNQCAKCHYTRDPTTPHALPIAGVSCESCHGPADSWNTIHSDLTDPDRLSKARNLGMIRPANIYDLAHQCVGCHTVPDERLVNVGGHNSGGGFEVVAWLQGEVRHNFIHSNGAHNSETTPERKRLFYIVGQGLALEQSVRESAHSTQTGVYSQERVKRATKALTRLRKIQNLISIQPLRAMLELGEQLDLKSGDKDALIRASDEIQKLNRRIAKEYTGAEFTALDELLPKPSDYIGKVHRP